MAATPTPTMRALHLTKSTPTSSAALALLTLPTPTPKPGSSQVLIKVHASAIHPSDLINAKGGFPLTTFPRIPGRDFSGTIISSPDFPSRVGEEVFGTSGNTQAFTVDGAQAEYILAPAAGVVTKPKNLSWVQAATIGVPFTTASTILSKAGLKKGETVLVLGANGAVGSAVVQLALAKGSKVLKGARGGKRDVDTTADPTLSALDGLTDGKGVDVVVDTVGQPALTAAAVAKLGRDGRLVFIASPRSGSTELSIDMLDFYRKGKTIVGVNTLLFFVEEAAKELDELREGFEEGSLKAAGEGEWNEVPLEDSVKAYEKAGERGAGKFVIVLD